MNDDDKPPTQADKFKKAARDSEADEDENRWAERLRKLVRRRPPPKDQ
jgi:hypothetical protein